MWKASAGRDISSTPQESGETDDWETDPDFVNDVTEQEQRWGSKTIEGSGRTAGSINMKELREETEKSDADKKKKHIEETNPGYGYGGKYGVETDRMDKSAVGHDYIGKVEKHASQTDHSTGFGGKFGVQSDRVDKSAQGWDHKEKVEKHASQKDYSTGFGGKFGIQSDRVDKSAVGWDHIEKVEKHESQKDYSKGFGGKFGVQEDRKDKSAVGWDHIESVEKHESQVDHKKGFGGKFGVQSDRMDKSALGFQTQPEKVGTTYTKTKPDIGGAKPSNLRAKFENFAQNSEDDTKARAAEQKRIREEKDKQDRDQAAKKQIFGDEDTSKPSQRKGAIDTGRAGGIGNAISAFNQAPSPTESTARKEPIKLPKQPVPVAVPEPEPEPIPEPIVVKKAQPPPDVVPIQEPIEEPLPQKIIPAEHAKSQPQFVEDINDNVAVPYSKVTTPASPEPVVVSAAETKATQLEAAIENNENLSQYIEDTGVAAIALYDYQAAADDEISFDPDDLVTHIEMIDEGWWRGLCKNRYGLFPANYVQLQNQ